MTVVKKIEIPKPENQVKKDNILVASPADFTAIVNEWQERLGFSDRSEFIRKSLSVAFAFYEEKLKEREGLSKIEEELNKQFNKERTV
jgi:hypothetical protein